MTWKKALLKGSLAFMTLVPIWTEGNTSTEEIPRNRLSMAYHVLSKGSTLSSLDGFEGEGHSLEFNHYLSFSYSVRDVATLRISQGLSSYIKSGDDYRHRHWEDPQISIIYNSIARDGIFNLSAQLRYYIPISRKTSYNEGREIDEKNGKLSAGLNASFKLSEGASFSLPVYLYKPLSRQKLMEGEERRRHLYFVIFPSLKFSLSGLISPYVAYSNTFTYHTNDISRNRGDAWNDWTEGESAQAGINWHIHEKLYFSSYVKFKSPRWIESHSTSVHFYAKYKLF